MPRFAIDAWERRTQPRASAASPLNEATSRWASSNNIIWLRSKRPHCNNDKSKVIPASLSMSLSILSAGSTAAYPVGASFLEAEACLCPRRSASDFPTRCFCISAINSGVCFVLFRAMTTCVACSNDIDCMISFLDLSNFAFNAAPIMASVIIVAAKASLMRSAASGNTVRSATILRTVTLHLGRGGDAGQTRKPRAEPAS
mmetsp:Transcript_4720/g.13168  ORF Transcript_4720/g.13168 Transcript_4720/m.13168 type:complete len:201 (+) Transcript_4720:1908-2510(+)